MGGRTQGIGHRQPGRKPKEVCCLRTHMSAVYRPGSSLAWHHLRVHCPDAASPALTLGLRSAWGLERDCRLSTPWSRSQPLLLPGLTEVWRADWVWVGDGQRSPARGVRMGSFVCKPRQYARERPVPGGLSDGRGYPPLCGSLILPVYLLRLPPALLR